MDIIEHKKVLGLLSLWNQFCIINYGRPIEAAKAVHTANQLKTENTENKTVIIKQKSSAYCLIGYKKHLTVFP